MNSVGRSAASQLVFIIPKALCVDEKPRSLRNTGYARHLHGAFAPGINIVQKNKFTVSICSEHLQCKAAQRYFQKSE